jgi:hypothetical protein
MGVVEPNFGTNFPALLEGKKATKSKRFYFQRLGCKGEIVDSHGMLFALNQEKERMGNHSKKEAKGESLWCRPSIQFLSSMMKK